MTLRAFADELSSDSPAPGGGSVAALAAACGAGLAAMVSSLAHAKKGYEQKHEALERIGVRAQELKDRLLGAVDADTAAFDRYLSALRLPAGSDEEKAAREKAVVEATIATIEVPLGTLEACPEVIDLCVEVAGLGLEASITDAGSGAEMARAAAVAAFENVCVNLPGLSDPSARASLLARADAALESARKAHARSEEQILRRVRAGAG